MSGVCEECTFTRATEAERAGTCTHRPLSVIIQLHVCVPVRDVRTYVLSPSENENTLPCCHAVQCLPWIQMNSRDYSSESTSFLFCAPPFPRHDGIVGGAEYYNGSNSELCPTGLTGFSNASTGFNDLSM